MLSNNKYNFSAPPRFLLARFSGRDRYVPTLFISQRLVLHNFLRHVLERIVNIKTSLCTGLVKFHIVLGCEVNSFLHADLLIRHVTLVGEQQFVDVGIGVLGDLAHPLGDVLEARPVVLCIHEDYTVGALVVVLGHREESLLPGCVPHLKLHLFVVDVHSFQFKVNSCSSVGAKNSYRSWSDVLLRRCFRRIGAVHRTFLHPSRQWWLASRSSQTISCQLDS